MKALRTLLDDLADIQARREQEADAIDAGEHNDYDLYDELEDDIADLLVDNAEALTALLGKIDTLATHLDNLDRAEGDGDDGHDEAIRVAARDLIEDAPTNTTPDTADGSPRLAELRQAHTRALHAADGDSNDEEIEAWRDTAEMATALVPGYQQPNTDH